MNHFKGKPVVTFYTLKQDEEAARQAEKEAAAAYHEAKKTFDECIKQHASEETKIVKALAFDILKEAQGVLKEAQAHVRKTAERVRVFGFQRRGAVSQNGRSIRL